jgi:murein DD-endopeptidase MepM/ murein hydrolase activator NlpD
VAGFRLMLRAGGPAEAAGRLGYLDHIASVERAALDEFSGARLRARQAENRATVAARQAATARQEAVAAVTTAAAAEVAAARAAARAAALADARATALAAAEAEREESLARYEQAEQAAERIAAEVRQWEEEQAALAAQAAQPPAPEPKPAAAARGSSGGVLMMPTGGWLSSPYGMRHDPFYGGARLHAGIDIAAAGGTPIHAADDGKVIRAGYNGGYGNFTCLSHGTRQGQGLSTCYAHQSEILVSEGQSVQRGGLIGRVGTTGASTGNHLHFEVRLDGSPTDPTRYLPQCLC